MKRILKVTLSCLMLLPVMTACSRPEEHIAKINLINDLGKAVEISLCDDYMHCESLSRMWPPRKIDIGQTQPLTISNELISVYRLSAKSDTKNRCLRVRPNKKAGGAQEIRLSSAQDC